MSDIEKSRLDLYTRYGLLPHIGDEGKPVLLNTMLSKRSNPNLVAGSRRNLYKSSINHVTLERYQTSGLINTRRRKAYLAKAPAIS